VDKVSKVTKRQQGQPLNIHRLSVFVLFWFGSGLFFMNYVLDDFGYGLVWSALTSPFISEEIGFTESSNTCEGILVA
jgi:hypothetical protein